MEYTQLQLQSTPASRWELKEALRNTLRSNDMLYATKASLFSGSYTDLTNKPSFATVATTGSFSDLVNVPFNVVNSQYVKMFSLSGLWQTSIGFNNDTDSYNQTAIGQYIKLRYPGVAVGLYNVPTNYANFIVGSGSAENARKNGLVVDTRGYVYICGVNGYDGTNTVDPTDGTRSLNNFLNNLSAENVAYDSTETYTSGTVGYAIKQLETASGGSSNNVAAEDVSYNASTAYTSGNVGYEIKQHATDLSTRLGGIKSTSNAESGSGAAIGNSANALAYNGRLQMYDAENQEYINVIYRNAGAVSVGEETCAIGEYSFAAGQGNNGGGNVSGYYYHLASAYESGDEYIYLQEEPVGQYLSFKESPYDDPSGDHVAKIVSKTYDNGVWEVKLAEPYIDRNINYDSWVYPITGSHGQNSSSFGMLTIAQGDGSTVVGKYNYPVSNELFSVGCGTGQPASTRKNAFIVLDDGSIYVKGVGNFDGTNAGQSGVLSLQDMLSSLGFGNTGGSSGSDPYGSDPYASDPYASDPYASDPYGSDPYGSDPYESDPYGSDPYGGGY